MSDVIAVPASPPPLTGSASRTFLPYLEGMRGFFGMYVAVIHVWLHVCLLRPNLFMLTPFASRFVPFSHSTIAVFMLISGYVIGLPVARRGQTFSGGIGTFLKRRALRILPAYYAALIIAIPISLLVLPVFGDGLSRKAFLTSVVLHFAMLHNLSNDLIGTIDTPMWSVAVECDVYVLFPLMLVPLARRLGFVPMVIGGFAVGFTPTFIGALHHDGESYRLSQACMWYIGLFALGYTAANFSIDRRPAMVRRLRTWPWGPMALAFAALAVASLANAKPNDLSHGTRWLTDLLAGLAIACQFTADAQAREHGKTTWFERFFLWRPLLLLGSFSYSFYLIHLPIIDLVMSRTQPGSSDVQVVELGIAGLVLALVVAYCFYLVFEKPFMTDYRRKGDAESLRSSQVHEIAISPVASDG